MSIDADVNMRVRQGAIRTLQSDGASERPDINHRGEQIVAPGLPPLTQLVNVGNSWWASTTTAAAPVTAIPTTAALLGLWNGEGGKAQPKCYVIDSVFAVIVANTAAVDSFGIMVNVSTQAVLTAIANTITPRGMRANRVYTGTGRVAVGITLDATNGVAANWMPVGNAIANSNTPQIGVTLDVPINGGIIVPPNGQIALTVMGGAATASSVQVGLRWHELWLPDPL